MKLVSNWRQVLLRAWSMRVFFVLLVLSGVEAAFPYFAGVIPLPPGAIGLIFGAIVILGMALRMIQQKGFDDA